MLIQGSVGQPSLTSIQPGTTPTMRQGQLGEVIVNELHGRYYETAYRRNMFSGTNQSGVTTVAGLVTGITGGLVLANPTSATVNLVLTKVGWAVTSAPTLAMVVGLMVGTSTTALSNTTSATSKNNFIGAASPQGALYSAATLPVTPTISHILGVTTITTLASQTNFVDLEGSLILPPGSFVSFYTSTASAATSFFGSFQWEEVPV